MGRRRRSPPSEPGSPPLGADSPNGQHATGADGNENRPGNGDDGSIVNLADTIGDDDNDDDGSGGSEPTRKPRSDRGRPRGQARKKESVDISGLIAENLFACHAFLAGLSGKDILRIEEKEAEQVGGAIQNVARHYDIPGVDQKTVDWIRLARTLGMVYGTRLFAMRMSAPAKAPAAAPKPEIKADTVQNANPNATYVPRLVRVSPGPGLPEVEVYQ